ncbi:MAG: APC family permease, partial [Pyrinomonadaceae bacterium]
RAGSRFQELTSFVKAVAFLVLVAACFIYGGDQQPPVAPVEPSPLQAPVGLLALFAAVMLALQSVIYAYDGWYLAIYFAEENKDPATSIPRALIISVVSVMAIYLMVNLALVYVLSLPQLAASTLPAGDAAQTIFGANGAVIISVLALITLPTIINSTLMVTPRTMFAMGRDGLFWAGTATVNKGGTPSAALILTVIVGLMLVLTGTFEILLSVTAFLFVLVYGSGFLAVFVLRIKEPDLPRPFKAWGYPWTTLVVLIGSVVFLIGQLISDTRNSAYSIAMIAASYPIFLIFKKLKQPALE